MGLTHKLNKSNIVVIRGENSMNENCTVNQGKSLKQKWTAGALAVSLLFCLWSNNGWAFRASQQAPLPNLDKRQHAAKAPAAADGKAAAVADLQARVPKLTVDFDPVTGSPK